MAGTWKSDAQQVERVWCDNIEPAVCVDEFGEHVSEFDVSSDSVSHGIHPVEPDREPGFQCSEAAAEWDLPVAVIDRPT